MIVLLLETVSHVLSAANPIEKNAAPVTGIILVPGT